MVLSLSVSLSLSLYILYCIIKDTINSTFVCRLMYLPWFSFSECHFMSSNDVVGEISRVIF